MKTSLQRSVTVLLCGLALTLISGCVTSEQKRRAAVELFQQQAGGEFENASGARLFIAPVRARMVTDEAIYVERHDANGVFARLISLTPSADGKKVMQRALVFTQDGQWRNLRENPEMFTALLPKDVRAAGTCDIQPAADANSIVYSCSGSAPETFNRKQQE